MTKYSSKTELLKDIRAGRRRLESNLAGLSAQQKVLPGVIGEWSVKDILAHLLDWEQRFLSWYRMGLKGETPEIPAPDLTWSQLDQLNQQIYERYRDMPLDEVQNRFDASSQEILALVEGMTEEELFTPGAYAWNAREVLAGWVASNTSSHYDWAKNKIRAWMKAGG